MIFLDLVHFTPDTFIETDFILVEREINTFKRRFQFAADSHPLPDFIQLDADSRVDIEFKWQRFGSRLEFGKWLGAFINCLHKAFQIDIMAGQPSGIFVCITHD